MGEKRKRKRFINNERVVFLELIMNHIMFSSFGNDGNWHFGDKFSTVKSGSPVAVEAFVCAFVVL